MDVKSISKKRKKSRVLNGSLNFTGTEALCADMKLPSLSAAHINTYALKVYKPTTPSMAVRVANGISSRRSTTAAITELGQFNSPLIPWNIQLVHCIIIYENPATKSIGGL